jgi:hypothetical protein
MLPLITPRSTKPAFLHCHYILCIVGRDHIDVHIRTVRRAEAREAKNTSTISHLVDGCGASGRMQNAVEASGFDTNAMGTGTRSAGRKARGGSYRKADS